MNQEVGSNQLSVMLVKATSQHIRSLQLGTQKRQVRSREARPRRVNISHLSESPSGSSFEYFIHYSKLFPGDVSCRGGTFELGFTWDVGRPASGEVPCIHLVMTTTFVPSRPKRSRKPNDWVERLVRVCACSGCWTRMATLTRVATSSFVPRTRRELSVLAGPRPIVRSPLMRLAVLQMPAICSATRTAADRSSDPLPSQDGLLWVRPRLHRVPTSVMYIIYLYTSLRNYLVI
jgi:hypothetical protein